jgi:phospholipid/cholesterol/gamma-HCH transport system substrate-binding protein
MKHTNDAIVGAAVVAVTALTLAGILWAKQTDVGSRQREVVAQFRDVGNARVGNAVVIRGVVGGRINAIELARGGWVYVRMKLDPAVSLPADPVVLLNESSLFGDWQATVIERRALPADDAVLAEVADASRERDIIPGASLPGIGKLTAVAGQIAGDVAEVAGRFGTTFDDKAARELRGAIGNVAALAATLRTITSEHASDLDTLSTQLRSAVTTLNRTTTSVEMTARRLDSAATSKEVRQLLDNFIVASNEMRHAAIQVRGMSEKLSTTQQRADAFLEQGDTLLNRINRGQGSLGLLANDPGLYRHTDSLVAELRALTADVRANPKKYVNVRIF